MWRVQFLNSPPREIESGAVLVANHRSSLDPFFVQLAAKRRVHWMVAKEFCTHFLFGPVLRLLEVIPTNRSGMDTASTKQAIRITSEGRLVGMFPEGKINVKCEEALLPLRGGAAVVALRSDVPMIPLWIEGSPFSKVVWEPIFMQARVKIRFGAPVLPIADRDGDSDDADSQVQAQVQSDQMILRVGKQIYEMAGEDPVGVKLASARKRRRASN